MPGKRLTEAQERCRQVHRRDTSRVPKACGPCGQRGSRPAEDLTSKTVACIYFHAVHLGEIDHNTTIAHTEARAAMASAAHCHWQIVGLG